MSVGAGIGVGVGAGEGENGKSICITSIQEWRLQSLTLLIYPNPLSPHVVAQEFLINQWLVLYPIKSTAWSTGALDGQETAPEGPANINPLSDPLTATLKGPLFTKFCWILSVVDVVIWRIFFTGYEILVVFSSLQIIFF